MRGIRHSGDDGRFNQGSRMQPTAVSYAVLVPVMAWAVYRRLRRHFGAQPLQRGRLGARVVLFAVIGAGLLASAWVAPRLGLGGGAGLLVGAVLGIYGLHLTRFDDTPQGLTYTPNRYIGFVLSALLLGRIAYRFAILASVRGQAMQDPNAMATLQRSPLTFAVVGVLIGYYLSYYGGLLWRTRQMRPASA